MHLTRADQATIKYQLVVNTFLLYMETWAHGSSMKVVVLEHGTEEPGRYREVWGGMGRYEEVWGEMGRYEEV